MIVLMATRVREVEGPAGRPCALCGGRRVVLVRSYDQAGAVDRLRARWGTARDANERFTDECRDCGARASVRPTPPAGRPARVGSANPPALPR